MTTIASTTVSVRFYGGPMHGQVTAFDVDRLDRYVEASSDSGVLLYQIEEIHGVGHIAFLTGARLEKVGAKASISRRDIDAFRDLPSVMARLFDATDRKLENTLTGYEVLGTRTHTVAEEAEYDRLALRVEAYQVTDQ